MKKLTLNVDELQVATFQTEEERDGGPLAAITGTICKTWPTVDGTCCTPLA